jgi:two-component system KDP operon response regulator KdpE
MPRILLVDDRVDSCTDLADMLRAAGYGVDCAYSGAAAIDHLANIGADLVVLDVVMPRLEGWQVLKWLRSHDDLADLPVVIHSRREDESQWQLAKQHGANELWVRGACSFLAMVDSLEDYFSPKAEVAA